MKMLIRQMADSTMVSGLVIACCVYAAAQPSSTVLEQLKREYVPSTLYDETSSVVTQAGITLAVRRPGISANPAIGDSYTVSFYGPHAGTVTQQKPASKRGSGKRLPFIDNLIVGEKVYVTNIEGTDSSVTLNVQTCTPSSQHASYQLVYRAALTFQFPQGYVEIANIKQIEASIGEVFTIASPAPPQVSGLFINSKKAGEQLRLNANGSFSLEEAGRSYTGRFSVNGDRLVLRISETGKSAIGIIRDSKIVDSGGQIWVQDFPASSVKPAGRQASQNAGSSDIVHAGQAMDEVKSLLGAPDKTENQNGTIIYEYSGLKVTFANGTVTRVQEAGIR